MKISFSLRSPILLRLGMSLLFLWFASQQFLSPEMWTEYLPAWLLRISPVGLITMVHVSGAIDAVFGICLLMGLFTRASALVLAAHMAIIAISVGYTPIGVASFGLVVAALAIFLNGSDEFSLDDSLIPAPAVVVPPPSVPTVTPGAVVIEEHIAP